MSLQDVGFLVLVCFIIYGGVRLVLWLLSRGWQFVKSLSHRETGPPPEDVDRQRRIEEKRIMRERQYAEIASSPPKVRKSTRSTHTSTMHSVRAVPEVAIKKEDTKKVQEPVVSKIRRRVNQDQEERRKPKTVPDGTHQKERQYRIEKLLDGCTLMSTSQFLSRYDGSKPDVTGVYILYNATKHKYYVGQAKNTYRRVRAHFAGRGNGYVFSDFRDGDKWFVTIVSLVESGYKNLDELERNAIHFFGGFHHGYNRNRGNGIKKTMIKYDTNLPAHMIPALHTTSIKKLV